MTTHKSQPGPESPAGSRKFSPTCRALPTISTANAPTPIREKVRRAAFLSTAQLSDTLEAVFPRPGSRNRGLKVKKTPPSTRFSAAAAMAAGTVYPRAIPTAMMATSGRRPK